MGNFYLLHAAEQWAAVCISKNACTSLKSLVLASHGCLPPTRNDIHAAVGFSAASPYLHPVSKGRPSGYFCFAVFRCPIQRFISLYRQFGLDAEPHRRYQKMIGVGFDRWIDFAARELGRPVLQQDEHFRRQSDYYRPEDVDVVIRIEELGPWFVAKGWQPPARENQSSAEFRPTPRQIRRIERLYEADFGLESLVLPAPKQ
jgi:hypothetical protein